MKTLHLNCLPFMCKKTQASKANESVSKCAKTGLCIGYCHEETHESHLNVTGVQFLLVTNLNRNLTQFMPSVIHCQPDSTEQNGSLRHLTTRNVF